MSRSLPRFLRVCSLAVVLAWPQLQAQPAAAPAAGAPLSAEKFFEPAGFVLPQLSASGTKLGTLERFDDVHQALILIDLGARTRRVLLKAPTASVINFHWKGDDLILALVREDAGPVTYRAIDLRTQKLNDLDSLSVNALRLMDLIPDHPDDVLFGVTSSWTDVAPPAAGAPPGNAIRVNLRTGKRVSVETDPGGSVRWLVGKSGAILGLLGYIDQKWYFQWRATPAEKWHRIEQAKNQPLQIIPLDVASDQRHFIVYDRSHGPVARVRLYDPATGEMGEDIGLANAEPNALLTWGDKQQINGFSYDGEKEELRFAEPEPKAVYDWLAKTLPGVSAHCTSFSHDNNRIVVEASSDRNPGVFYLLDWPTQKLTPLGVANKAVNPNLTAPGRAFHFATSDGLTLTGRLTLPPNIDHPPLILLTNPDLWSKVDGSYDPVMQFFAARGYATARVNWRGTNGFGRAFAAAGDFEIAGKVSRDLAETAQWLAAQNLVDGKRMAIFANGMSGLAALPLAGSKDGPFRVLINFDTPLALDYRTMNEMLASARLETEDELLARIGGRKAFEDYRKTLDPMAMAGKIALPSFHFYSRGIRNNVFAPTLKLDGMLKKSPLPSQLVNSDSHDKEVDDDWLAKNGLWRETARHYEEAAAFLAKNL